MRGPIKGLQFVVPADPRACWYACSMPCSSRTPCRQGTMFIADPTRLSYFVVALSATEVGISPEVHNGQRQGLPRWRRTFLCPTSPSRISVSSKMMSFQKESHPSRVRASKSRADRHHITWARFGPHANRWLPRAHILQPYPKTRFRAVQRD
jgi:hypothetical protein